MDICAPQEGGRQKGGFFNMAIVTKEKSFFVGNDNWIFTTIYSIIISDLELNFVI